MSELKEILKQIEELRASMIELKEGKGFTDMEVVAASQMLDVVLNEYYKILRKKVDG